MGAPNFGRTIEAGGIYSIFMETDSYLECPDCGSTYGLDEFENTPKICSYCYKESGAGTKLEEREYEILSSDIEEFENSLRGKFEEVFGKENIERSLPRNSRWENGLFAVVFKGSYYVDFELKIELFKEIGYHAGARIDYETTLELYRNYSNIFEFSDWEKYLTIEEFSYCGSLDNLGLAKIALPRFIKKITEKRQEIVDQIEEILKEYTTPLGVFAQFSNGETIYSKI